jgi:hypothetical protein
MSISSRLSIKSSLRIYIYIKKKKRRKKEKKEKEKRKEEEEKNEYFQNYQVKFIPTHNSRGLHFSEESLLID